MISKLPDALYLAGPTAVGKSAVAVELAQALRGELISVDSMQVYRGMDIGTAKPTAAERQRVPHHLIDVVEVSEAFDAARFVGLARQAALYIQRRGRLPIFCGGTGLYFQAYLEGLSELPPANPALRKLLESISDSELLTELAAADPIAAERIDKKNRRRLIRAVEVIRLTGKPFSHFRPDWTADASDKRESQTLPFFVMVRSADDLRNRVNARVRTMFSAGLVAETKQLLSRNLRENRTAMQAIGYRQVVEYLDGLRSLPETELLVQQRTAQFARRQRTWFRHQTSPIYLKVVPDEEPQKTAAALAEDYLRRTGR